MSSFPATEALLSSGASEDVARVSRQLDAHPEDVRARLLLADFCFKQGHRQAALEQASEAYRLAPHSVQAIYLFVGLLSAFQEFSRVVQVAEQSGEVIETADSNIKQIVLSLADRARVNLGEVPANSIDPAFKVYSPAALGLAAIKPVQISDTPAEDNLKPIMARMLAAYRAAFTKPGNAGKSTHWDRFRPDFERIILSEEIWPAFRAFGLCHGLDDDLLFLDQTRPFTPVTASPDTVTATAAPFAVATLYELVDRSIGGMLKQMPEDRLASLCEASIGEALAFKLDHFPVAANFHDLSCVKFAHSMSAFLPDTDACRYLEIGGGYGATAAKMKQIQPQMRVTLVDLPETCAFQFYYLSRRFPDAVILTPADLDASPEKLAGEWDFLILPSTRYNLAQNLQFDFAANIRSFMEMPISVVQGYMRWIARALAPGGICYLANRLEKHNGDEVVRMDDYGAPEHWKLISDHPVTAQAHIQERVYRNG